jgi:ribosomal small subunit protein bTHX
LQKKLIVMGKGDKRTKRGKIVNGTFGKFRPRKQRNVESLKEQSTVKEDK